MKILFLATGVFDKGGISRYSRYQISAIKNFFGDNAIKVLSLLGPGGSKFEFENSIDIDWYGGKLSLFNKLRFIWKSFYYAIIFKPDIILSCHIGFSPLSLFLSKIIGSKSICNAYGLEIWSTKSQFIKFCFTSHDMIISDCNNTAEYIRTEFKYMKKISVVWDPVDLNQFQPRRPNIELFKKYNIPYSEKNLYVLSLCRLSKAARHKGIDRIIKVFGQLQSYPHFHYLVAGDGDDKEWLRQLANDYECQDNVHFLGSIPESSMAEVYNLCDLFVLITDIGYKRGEGIPMTPMEAAACGKPLLLGNQDGSKEMINNGEGGYILDPFDFEEIKKHIILILNDNKLRMQLSTQALDHIKSNFAFEIFAEKTSTIIKAII
jgi:phosphatidyl-myo-inositol dimannoside synthase